MIIDFNERLREALDIYASMIKVKKRNTLRKHFEKVKIGIYGQMSEKKECGELKLI